MLSVNAEVDRRSSLIEGCVGLREATFPGEVRTVPGERDIRFTIVVLVGGSGAAARSIICEGAFRRCTALKQVILSEGLTTIGTLAFAHCSSLEGIHVPASVEWFDEAFPSCSGLNRASFLFRIGARRSSTSTSPPPLRSYAMARSRDAP